MSKKEDIIYKGSKLHKGQRRIIENLLNVKTKINVINASRQSGKTHMLQQLVLYYAINNPKTINLIVSPFNSQNLRIYSEIKAAIIESGVIQSDNKSDKIIHLINGSQLVFKSAENADAMRGISTDFLFADEFAFWKKDVWDLVVRPTLAAKKHSRAFLFSTPRGKNEFFDMANRGKSTTEDNKNYSYYYMNYSENPMYDLEFVEDARRHYPPAKFKQEFLGEFVDGGSVFSNYQKCAVITKYRKPEPNKTYFAGLDLANKQDRTVLTVMDNNGKVVMMYSNNKTEWKKIVSDVVKILREYSAHCIIETNSIGDVVYELIEDQYTKISPIFTSNSNKQEYIEELILGFNSMLLQIPNKDLNEELHLELDVFEMTYSSKTRKIVYSAREGFHDDTIISLALAYKSKLENKMSGNYVMR